MESASLSETKKLMSMAQQSQHEIPGYLADDLMIIDNIKMLGVQGGIRPNMNIIVICSRGGLRSTINDEPFEFKARQVFLCPPDVVLGEMSVTADFEYLALCISTQALQNFLRGYVGVWNEMVYVRRQRVFNMTDIDMQIYEKAYDLIVLCLKEGKNERDKASRDVVMRGFLSASLIGLCHLIQREEPQPDTAPKQNHSIFNEFLELLQTCQVKHRPVRYYASKLCITPKYLTMICKKTSGKTANEWIREYTLSDIIYELRNTTQTIKEISNHLGFPNTSFFGKYVRDHLGCTPLEYRARQCASMA